jgi:hypothetical protein
MHHRTLAIISSLAFVWMSTCVVPAEAQEWVKAMFEETEHDFGTVPRGAKAEYEFKLVNKYQETIHIDRVKSSCGCTTPRIKKADLKTYEEGSIVCEFNTESFIGPKTAQVTVVFTQPFYGEMQLNVRGNIRSDIQTEPGVIEFGEVDRGMSKATQVKISYAGRNPWEITDVRSVNDNLGVQLEPINQNGRIGYIMKVMLKDTAPAGDFSDQIVLVTNEPQFNLVTIPVRGVILPPVSMPVSIELGSIKVEDAIKSRMVIKSKEEFAITDIKCPDARFRFTAPEGKKKVHIIPIDFSAGNTAGAFRIQVSVTTSLPEGGQASTIISGNVVN